VLLISSNKTLTNTISRNGIFQPNTEISTTENRTDNSNLRNNLAILKLGSKFKPNTNFQFDYDISFQINQTEDNDLITNSVTFTLVEMLFKTTLLSRSKARAYSSKSECVLDSKQKKSTWALEMQHLYQMKILYSPDLLVDPFPFFRF
jgi:hypothetical protein